MSCADEESMADCPYLYCYQRQEHDAGRRAHHLQLRIPRLRSHDGQSNLFVCLYSLNSQIYELRKVLGDLNTSLQTIDPDAPSDEIFTIPLNVLTGVLIGVIAAGCVILTILACYTRREFG